MAERVQTVDVRVKARLDAVVVRPGDTLVVRLAGNVTREQFDEYRAHLDGLLPGVKTVVLNADQLLVYRPDGAAEDA